MNNSQKWFVILAVLCLALVGSFAQMQTSSSTGQAVTLSQYTPNSGRLPVDGSGVTQPVNIQNASLPVTGTFWQATQPVSLASLPALAAGSNLIGKVVPATECGTTALNTAFAAVPTSATSITATTTCIDAITVSNTNSSGQTILITDGQGSPVTLIPTTQIPGNSTYVFPLHFGKATSGIKWTAGGSGMTGSVSGYQ